MRIRLVIDTSGQLLKKESLLRPYLNAVLNHDLARSAGAGQFLGHHLEVVRHFDAKVIGQGISRIRES